MPPKTLSVADAHRAVLEREQALTLAQAELDNAREQLDQAFAAVGWRRMVGGFPAGAPPIYECGDEALSLASAIARVGREAA